jgi:hypothetical protein
MSESIKVEDLEGIRKKSPFSHLNIQDDTVLYQHEKRLKCEKCHRNMKHYCYYCFHVMGMDRSEVPFVKLPATLDV